MKPKILLLSISLFGAIAAMANTEPEATPCTGTCKKRVDEVNGVIINAESKKPLRDVSITAYLVSKKERSIITDEDGTYAFDELKPGTYRFIFEKAGFKRVTKEKVVIKTDETFQLNIEMIESKDSELMPSPFHF